MFLRWLEEARSGSAFGLAGEFVNLKMLTHSVDRSLVEILIYSAATFNLLGLVFHRKVAK